MPQAIPLPSPQWRDLASRPKLPRLPTGLDAAWEAFAARAVYLKPRTKNYMQAAQRVLDLESKYASLDQADFDDMIQKTRELFRRGRQEITDVDKAFAIVREVAFRTIGLKAHPNQVAAALAMHDGRIAEVATGEGKTLIATLPATVAGWIGRGCHVITVNDYLAERDAQTMTPVYAACGITVGFVTQEIQPPQRRAAYNADVTYTTNKEAAADYLRDRLTLGPRSSLTDALLDEICRTGSPIGSTSSPKTQTDILGGGGVMRGLECVIVDEADSVLIDEAVTPLIISGSQPNAAQVRAYQEAAELAKEFDVKADYVVNRQYREVRLTPRGRSRLQQMCSDKQGLWSGVRRAEELLVQAITADELFVEGVQYVIQNGKVVIVDESTGRLMPDREWRDGLHQAVSAKEGVEVEPPKATLARISFQRFFRMYRKLSGMTGTAWEERAEMWQTYRSAVVRIPTHRPLRRTQHPDQRYSSEEAKWSAVVDEIVRVHQMRCPILVGTRSVAASESLSVLLNDRGIEHEVLNAVRHDAEAQVIAEAGQVGRVTIATNMAGRGTDIKLGQGVADMGGLCVIATERHDTRRIDRQLFGRSGRQGDPGSAMAFVCDEDELLKRHATLKKLPAAVRRAQARAQRKARQQRRSLLKQDENIVDSLGFAGIE